MMQSALARACALAVVAIAIGSNAGAQVAPGQVAGPLSIIIGDPLGKTGTPQLRTYIYDEATRRQVEVTIDSVTAAPFGGHRGLDRRRVSVDLGTAGRVTAIRSVTAVPTGGARGSGVTASATAAMGVANTNLLGTQKYALLPCRFADSPPVPSWDMTTINTMMSGTGSGMSVKEYWTESSTGLMTLDISPVQSAWKTMPSNWNNYVDGVGTYLDRLFKDCMDAHDADVNYSTVDGVVMQFDKSIGCCFFGGGAFTTYDGVTKRWAMMWMAGTANPTELLGVYAHEMGHTFGLLHSRPPDGNTYTSDWDVMSNSASDTVSGVTFGAQTLAVQKDFLGWIPSNRRCVATGVTTTITLERNALPGSNGNCQITIIPIGTSQLRFYAVELRQKAGFDVAIPREGIVIHEFTEWRIEPAWVVDQDGNRDANDDGAVWTAGETFYDVKNGISVTVNSIGATSASLTVRNMTGITFNVSALGGKRTMAYGAAAVVDTVMQVKLAGVGAEGLAWRAEHIHRPFIVGFPANHWLTVLDTTRLGSGVVRVRHDPAVMGAGTFVDSIRVSVAGFMFPIVYFDTLVVTAPSELTLGLLTKSRSDSMLGQLRPTNADSVTILISGPGASTAAWTVQAKKPWTEFHLGTIANPQRVTGTGPAKVYYGRQTNKTSGPGPFIDTITVTMGTQTAIMIDTLIIDPPVQYTLSRVSKKYTMYEGENPLLDSVTVQLSGKWATVGEWWGLRNNGKVQYFIEPVRNYQTFVRGYGEWRSIGNDKMYFYRGNPKLPVGTYIDTLYIKGPWYASTQDGYTPAGHQTQRLIIDTLVVEAPPARSLQVSSASRRDTVLVGMSASIDSVLITPVTVNAQNEFWVATSRQGRVVVNYGYTYAALGGGKGSSWLIYQRKSAGLEPGTYVDTIDVATIVGTPVSAQIIDTLVVIPGTAMSLSALSRRTAIPTASPVKIDSLEVDVFGSASAGVTWTAAKKGAWTTLTTSAGTGSGKVRWSRNANGLPPGTYVDTITVTATNATLRPVSIIDTFVVTAASYSLASRISPDSTDVITGANFSATLSLDMAGSGAALGSYTASISWNGAVVAFDSIRAVAGGFAAPVAGATTSSSLAFSATDASGKTGDVALARVWFHTVGAGGTFSVISPAFTAAATNDPQPIDLRYTLATPLGGKLTVTNAVMSLSSAARKNTAFAGQAPVPDSVDVQISGSAAATTAWAVTKKGAWTTLAATGGTGPGKLRWTKSANALAVGTYVDTLTITSAGLATKIVVDTFIVAAPTLLASAAMSPDSSGGVIGLAIPATLSIDLGQITQSLGSYTATVTWDSTVVRLDSTVSVANGFAAPTVTVNNKGKITLAASDATGKTGNMSLARLHFRMLGDTPGTSTAITPEFTAAASIASQQTNLLPSVTTKAGKVAVVAGALRGDVNLDGTVTAADALAIIRAATGVTATGIRPTPNGDANCNGKVEAVDAQIVLRLLVGLPVETFCVGTIK